MSERTEVSFDAALMIALRADAQKELDELPTPAQLKERSRILPDGMLACKRHCINAALC